MSLTLIANLYVPALWILGLAEKALRNLRLYQSGVLTTKPEFNQLASGPGTTVEIPFFGPVAVADEIQVEDTAPSVNNVASKLQRAPILNRVFSLGATALAEAVGVPNPVQYILDQITNNRSINREDTLISILLGLFSSTNNGQFGVVTHDVTNGTGTGGVVSPENIIAATGKTGVLRGKFQNGGVLFLAISVETALLQNDLIDYQKDSEGKFTFNEFMGLRVISIDDSKLAVAGSGPSAGTFTYTTFILAPGAVGYGEKPQVSGVDVSSLNLVQDLDKNNIKVIDRTRFLMVPGGSSWDPTNSAPAGQSYTNAELQAGKWLRVVAAQNLPFVALKTNG